MVDIEEQREVQRVGTGGQGFLQDAVALDVFYGDAAQLVLAEVVGETGPVPSALMREIRTCRLEVSGQVLRRYSSQATQGVVGERAQGLR